MVDHSKPSMDEEAKRIRELQQDATKITLDIGSGYQYIDWRYLGPILLTTTLPAIRIGFKCVARRSLRNPPPLTSTTRSHRPLLRDFLFFGTIGVTLVYGGLMISRHKQVLRRSGLDAPPDANESRDARE